VSVESLRYEVIIYWSAEDKAFVAEVPELPGCAADGPSLGDALANVEVVAREWIETARELGRDIPVPRGRLTFARALRHTNLMHCELWDLDSRNMLADFDTEQEALTAVRDLLAINSPDVTNELTLVWRDGDCCARRDRRQSCAILSLAGCWNTPPPDQARTVGTHSSGLV